jgi:hypothetical protein
MIAVALGIYASAWYLATTVTLASSTAPYIYWAGPGSSQSASSPDLLSANTVYQFWCWITGVTQSEVSSVILTITGSTAAMTIPLYYDVAQSSTMLLYDTNNPSSDPSYRSSFTTGAAGSTYVFEYVVTTTTGVVLVPWTGYGAVANIQGYAQINGQNVTPSSTITVTSTPINVTYVVTYPPNVNVLSLLSSGGCIVQCRYAGTLYDTVPFTNASAPQELYASVPLNQGYGTYNITAVILYGSSQFWVMSMLSFSSPNTLGVAAVFSWILGLVGAAFTVYGLVLPAERVSR